MHDQTYSLVRRYARQPRMYHSYIRFDAEPAATILTTSPSLMIERKGLRLVVQNTFLPNPTLTSHHYHTGE